MVSAEAACQRAEASRELVVILAALALLELLFARVDRPRLGQRLINARLAGRLAADRCAAGAAPQCRGVASDGADRYRRGVARGRAVAAGACTGVRGHERRHWGRRWWPLAGHAETAREWAEATRPLVVVFGALALLELLHTRVDRPRLGQREIGALMRVGHGVRRKRLVSAGVVEATDMRQTSNIYAEQQGAQHEEQASAQWGA